MSRCGVRPSHGAPGAEEERGMASLQVAALVTGATSGLGKAMAEALLQAGMEVAVAARPTPR